VDLPGGGLIKENPIFSRKCLQAEEQPDGGVLFKLHIAVTPEFVNWPLYYGSRVEELEPQELRERVVEEHRSAAGVCQ
jgi:predicted DNA-binding transcriptional regulator YafY